MRVFVVLLFAAAIDLAGPGTFAAEKIRLAQSSALTNCMMMCNGQAANCQTTCLVPSATIPGSLNGQTPINNPTASTTCLLSCTTTQLTCQTNCASQSR